MTYCKDFGLNPYDPNTLATYDHADYIAYRELQSEKPEDLAYDRQEMLLFAIYACMEVIINGFGKKGDRRFEIMAHKALHLKPWEPDDTLSHDAMIQENLRLAAENRAQRIVSKWLQGDKDECSKTSETVDK